MCPCRISCTAYITNNLTLRNTISHFQILGILRQMQISRSINWIMLDFHHITLLGLISLINYHTITDTHNLCSCRSCIIDTGMSTHLTGYRMSAAIRESWRYSGITQRCLQECLTHTLSLLIPIIISTTIVKVVSLILFIPVMKLCIQHISYTQNLSLIHSFLIHCLERVTFLQTKKVNTPGINIGKFNSQQTGSTFFHKVTP